MLKVWLYEMTRAGLVSPYVQNTQQVENHQSVCAAGGVIPLVEIANAGPRSYPLLRDDGTIDEEGMSDPLRQPTHDEELIQLLGYDVECRRYGVVND